MDIALLMILVMAKVAYIFALSLLAGLAIFVTVFLIGGFLHFLLGDDGDFCARHRP